MKITVEKEGKKIDIELEGDYTWTEIIEDVSKTLEIMGYTGVYDTIKEFLDEQ